MKTRDLKKALDYYNKALKDKKEDRESIEKKIELIEKKLGQDA
jgi:hypothetical protein